jgi:hypothetical protein
MNTYNFTAKCKSGQVKSFTFQANGYLEARNKLQQLIDSN